MEKPIYHKKLSPITKMLAHAKRHHYAIGHFNIHNLEFAKAFLITAQLTNTPLILATSERAIKYMGGVTTVVGMINGLLEDLNITVPVALHLDHATRVPLIEAAIKAGYSSVMADLSELNFEDNYKTLQKIIPLAQEYYVSVEGEIGSIGGEEDGMIRRGELADPAQAVKLKSLGLSALAAGIGNIHGPYPADWEGLSFDVLETINKTANLPLVLHGGSGIPQVQVKKAISMGIAKVNVSTECKLAFQKALHEYFKAGKDTIGKGYDVTNIMEPGMQALGKIFVELVTWFGCLGKGTEIQKSIKD